MMKRNVVQIVASFLVLCLLMAPTVFTQQTLPQQPPELKAITEARRIKEPAKKLEALEKVVKDYPQSSYINTARQAVIETLIKHFPDQQDRIRTEAQKFLAQADSSGSYNFVAIRLLDAGLMLDWAVELSEKATAKFEEDMAKSTRLQRAGYQATKGRIYLKQGKIQEAEKLLMTANENNPGSIPVLTSLAEIAEKKGNETAALDYLAQAALRGPMKAAERLRFETLYRKSHKGSLAGIEEMLDERYRTLYPAMHVERYKAPSSRTTRTVLAELFTGSGCAPCVAADLGFDLIFDRYNRQEVAVLVYHLHIPLPDPMTNPSTQTRAKFYSAASTPTYVIDGNKSGGGGSRDGTRNFYNKVNPGVEERLVDAPEADLKLETRLEGGKVMARVRADQIKGDPGSLKLQIILAEDLVRFTGENGVRFHSMVVRSLGGDSGGGFSLVAGEGNKTVEWSFDLGMIEAEAKKHLDGLEEEGFRGDDYTFSDKRHKIDPRNLSVVAFVQEEESRNVLQSTYQKVKPPVSTTAQKVTK
jgi:tetratricopeptide (TPR) repeat protein